MSNIYLNEPPTCGKVLLHTSSGDIDVELWSKEAPLACRNFIQLSLEGYYDNTLFHRVIKDFMVQGGDPTNTGTGGTSCWGRPFKDEIHGRLKFNHRGQLAMANENRPNTNQSQFFLTLGDCEWLNRKHTIFGKVTGNTIFNLLRLSDVECQNEKPVEDIVLKSVEVLWNPFDDILPRNSEKPSSSNNTDLKCSKKTNRKGKKDTKLLSFGGDDEEASDEMTEEFSGKIKSAHDVIDCVLSSKIDVALDKAASGESCIHSSQHVENRRRSDKGQRKGSESISKSTSERTESSPTRCGDIQVSEKISRREKSKQVDNMKKEVLKSRQAVKVMTGEAAQQHRDEEAFRDLSTPLERQRQRYVKRKREHGDREKETLSKLLQFSNTMKKQKNIKTSPIETVYSATYKGQVFENENDHNDDGNDDSWHVGKLKFRKHIDDISRGGNDYKVIDPKISGHLNYKTK